MTKGELELKRDDIIKQIMGLQEQLKTIDTELSGMEVAEQTKVDPNKPVQMYQDYKSW